jgi:hypothetical protein
MNMKKVNRIEIPELQTQVAPSGVGEQALIFLIIWAVLA